jgi:hypothetical protein
MRAGWFKRSINRCASVRNDSESTEGGIRLVNHGATGGASIGEILGLCFARSSLAVFSNDRFSEFFKQKGARSVPSGSVQAWR